MITKPAGKLATTDMLRLPTDRRLLVVDVKPDEVDPAKVIVTCLERVVVKFNATQVVTLFEETDW